MRRIMTTVLLSASLAMPAAWADQQAAGSAQEDEFGYTDPMYDERGVAGEEDQAGRFEEDEGFIDEERDEERPGRVDDRAGVLEREEPGRRFAMERVGVKPQLGTVVYNNPAGDTESRFMGGLTMDFNLASIINPNRSHWYLGPSTGLLYSHIGNNNANFFGGGVDGGSSFAMIPANVKFGYSFTDTFRAALRGGGNFLWRSNPGTMNVAGGQLGDGNWNILPNFGADIEMSLGGNVGIMLRPDITFTDADNLFATTLAVTFPLS